MPGAIYLIQGEELVEMNEEKYESEEVLQGLLAQYSKLLAGDQIDSEEPRHWLFVASEVGVPSEESAGDRFSLDHLFLDQDGVPTLVELKRSTNTDIRRKVVGQMLDYAANAVVYWPVEKLQELFRTTCAENKRKPEEELSNLLGPKGDSTDFWQRVKTNLQIGKIRMIFVADEIPIELRRIVEFLNVQMDPAEVLALEVRQYAGKGLKSLVPRIIGQTVTKMGNPPGEVWTKKRFLEAVRKQTGEGEVEVAGKILDWADKGMTRTGWGRGKKYGCFSPILEHKGTDFYPFGVWTSGEVVLYFRDIKAQPPFDSEEKRLELLTKLNSFADKVLSKDAISDYPKMHLSGLKDSAKLEKFISTFDWFAKEVKAS